MAEKKVVGIPPLSELAPEPGKCGAVVCKRDRNGTRRLLEDEDGNLLFSHYCVAYPVKGAKTCNKHGSGNQLSKKAGAARLQKAAVEKEALASVRRWGLSEVNYQEAILEELKRTHAVVLYLDGIIADPSHIDEDAGTEQRGPQLATTIQWWHTERAKLVQVTALVHKMGIDERQIALQEGQARIMVSVIKSVLDSLALTPQQQSLAPTVVRQALMAASSQAVAA